jgi:hypothetical protein
MEGAKATTAISPDSLHPRSMERHGRGRQKPPLPSPPPLVDLFACSTIQKYASPAH